MAKVSRKRAVFAKYRQLLIITGALILVLLVSLGLSLASKPITTFDECVAAGNEVQDSHPQTCATKSGKQFTQSTANTQTFEGTVVCMPHKNTDGPQTLECAIGIKTEEGAYYSIKTNDLQHELNSKAGSDKKVRITGAVTADPSPIYQSSGVLNLEAYEFLN